MQFKMTTNRALAELEKRFKQAEALLKDDAKMEPFLNKLERKLKRIPFLGQMDDALVIATVWKYVNKDIEDYRKWKQGR